MIASASPPTSTGTWIALASLVLMMIPVYISSLKGAKSYGRLEQKVDALALAQSATAIQNAETARLLADTVGKLTDQFQAHAIADASNFGELRGLYAGRAAPPLAPSATVGS